jgi:hypothetical protein
MVPVAPLDAAQKKESPAIGKTLPTRKPQLRWQPNHFLLTMRALMPQLLIARGWGRTFTIY